MNGDEIEVYSGMFDIVKVRAARDLCKDMPEVGDTIIIGDNPALYEILSVTNEDDEYTLEITRYEPDDSETLH